MAPLPFCRPQRLSAHFLFFLLELFFFFATFFFFFAFFFFFTIFPSL